MRYLRVLRRDLQGQRHGVAVETLVERQQGAVDARLEQVVGVFLSVVKQFSFSFLFIQRGSLPPMAALK